jgi:sulfoxide reductase catalytic subunit YedY
MLIKIPRGWELPESAATPEAVFMNRRDLIKTAAAGTMMLGAGPLLARTLATSQAWAATEERDPSAALYPVARNEKYVLDRPLSDETLNGRYNNFYEFGSHKEIWRAAQDLPVRPWTVKIDGMVEQEMEVGIDDLLAKMALEERLYRHRCVEAWSMTIPWSGFPMKALVDLAAPLGSAKYVKMVTFHDPDVASGQKQFWYPWAYTEGLTIAEATSELAFLVTGTYGHPAAKQHGAPLRLAVPWKYGFKSIKSIVSFTFTDERPKTFWEEVQGREYGFWANVNPAVAHPRWSQATERVLGTDERLPTLIYNGYGEFAAPLYEGMADERLFA